MRIVIDLQACQSGSRHRGIGRYAMALTEGIIRLADKHEVILVLSGLFPHTIEPLKTHFKTQLPLENIHVWYAPAPLNSHQSWQMNAAKIMREAFLKNLNPDIVLITSLFEGFTDNAITSVGEFDAPIPTAIVLYDLIPMLYPEIYLSNPEAKAYYEQKISYLERADLILAISDSAKDEIKTAELAISSEIITAISGAAEDYFKIINYSKEEQATLRSKYTLNKDFLMYTGGIDPRKNIEGLIQSFAQLPPAILKQHQLAIVCAVNPSERQRLVALIKHVGLTTDDVIITGFVTDNDLVALYNLCKAFVFPSKHEGFGLPILEAMMCGAPVIGSNLSSIPEVMGFDDALFNPYDIDATTHKITQVLTDDEFRHALITHGAIQARQFSWDKTAQKALLAMEHWQREKKSSLPTRPISRPKLAFISPLPPEQSGIAHYSSMLIPALAQFYDIDVIIAQAEVHDEWIAEHCSIHTVDWFLTHANMYQRVLYHFGNSTYHTHQFDLIKKIPGVIVLHDFYLSGILSHLEMTENSLVWSHALYNAHGYDALYARYNLPNSNYLRNKYPCNKAPIDASLGVIVHSNESLRLAKQWLHEPHAKHWFKIPHLRPLCTIEKSSARAQLRINQADFVVCSFGFLSSTKLNLELLTAWHHSILFQRPNSLLIFVGEACEGYREDIQAFIQNHHLEERILITGWACDGLFENYLSAADIAVQLRTDSRGETSGAVLACLAAGLPTIVNAHGSMADLPDDAVWMLNDKFSQDELVNALNTIADNQEKRDELSEKARSLIKQRHAAQVCAEHYFNAIEASYAHAKYNPQQVLQTITQIEPLNQRTTMSQKDILLLTEAIAANQPPLAVKQLFIDISHWKRGYKQRHFEENLLRHMIHHPPAGYRIEPIIASKKNRFYRYARKITLKYLNCPTHVLKDEIIAVRKEDCYLNFSHALSSRKYKLLLDHLSRRGVVLYLATHVATEAPQPTASITEYLNEHFPYIAWKRQLHEALQSID